MIKSFLQKIFSKKPKENIGQCILSFPDENYVSAVVDKHNRVIIRMQIHNTDETSAQKFAETLVFLNNGVYQAKIIEILKELAINEPDKNVFVEKTINYWKTYIELYSKTEEQPCVSPLSFSSLLTKKESNE
jgi:Tfp pilus assembly protein FimT